MKIWGVMVISTLSISTHMAAHVTVQHVSTDPVLYGLPVACSPLIIPPWLCLSHSHSDHQICWYAVE
jgi:hypothetical protein